MRGRQGAWSFPKGRGKKPARIPFEKKPWLAWPPAKRKGPRCAYCGGALLGGGPFCDAICREMAAEDVQKYAPLLGLTVKMKKERKTA